MRRIVLAESIGPSALTQECYEKQLVITREIGDRQGEAIASWNLGAAYEKQGDLARAGAAMDVYVKFLQEIGHPDAEKRAAQVAELRQRLAGQSS